MIASLHDMVTVVNGDYIYGKLLAFYEAYQGLQCRLFTEKMQFSFGY